MKLHNPIADTKLSAPMIMSIVTVIFFIVVVAVLGFVMLIKVLGPITTLVLFFILAAFGPVYYMFTGKDPYKK